MKRISLHHAWDRMRTVPGLGRNTAVVVVVVVIGLVVAAVDLSKSRFIAPWEDRQVVWAEFEEAPGTTPETKHLVTIAGVEVGEIVGWEATDEGTARIEMSLEPGHQIYDNATAVMRTVNPLNQMYIEIDPGGPPGTPLPEDGVIPVGQTQRAIQPDEVLSHLDQRARDALTALLRESDVALARAPKHLPEGLAATNDTLRGLRPAMEALQARRENMKKVVTSMAHIANAAGANQERVARLADSLRGTLGVLARNDEQLRSAVEQLPGLNSELRRALTSTQGLTEQLNPTLDAMKAASDVLPPALERFTDTTKQIGETVDKARPVVNKARPVVADLRPFIADTDEALDDARPITTGLDRDTRIVTSYLEDIRGFVYNTSSVFSVEDGRGPIIRGHVIVPLPDGGAWPGSRGGYAPSPEASGIREGGSQ